MVIFQAPSVPLDLPANRLLKRGMDLMVSTLLIVLILSWLIPLLAIAIVLDSRGKVFFIQYRRKRAEGVFPCIKFRTMRPNDYADTRIACPNDPRITRMGAYLRKHHIDELPQLFNVWWGNMSLVGPRPYMLSEDEYYREKLPGYEARSLVKPGITGLAQSRGLFGGTPHLSLMQERLRIDTLYVEHWSPVLDWIIVYQTVYQLMLMKPIYELPAQYI